MSDKSSDETVSYSEEEVVDFQMDVDPEPTDVAMATILEESEELEKKSVLEIHVYCQSRYISRTFSMCNAVFSPVLKRTFSIMQCSVFTSVRSNSAV